MRSSFQQGSLVKVHRKSGDAWRFRWRDGSIHHSEWLGTVKQLPTRSHAEKAAQRFRNLANSDVECITISDLIAKFWKESPPERETTAHSYRSIMKRVEDKWGRLRIDSFCGRVLEVEQWLKELQVIGRHPGGPARPVSSLYRGQVRNVLHLLIEKAMLWQHVQVERNPIDLIRLKGAGARTKELTVLTPEQYSALLEDPQLPEVVKVLAQVLAGLGLRISEALGLQWSDFDFEAKTIQIQRSMVHGKANNTKTSISAAKLPLHDSLIETLRQWKEHETFKSKWVFCSERTGLPYDRDYLRSEYLQPAGERIGVDRLGFHSFRHGYRAMLRTSGVDLETQKNLLRHARIRTTIDVYGGEDNAERLRPANSKVVEMLPQRRSA